MTDPALFSQGPARHYGMEIAATGDTLLVAEPETESVLVFALSGTTPLMVTKLGGLGTLADDLYRVCDVAIAAGGRELVATDAAARRVNRYRLDRDAASELRFDPRLGRFVEGADLDRLPLELDGVPIEREGGIEPGAVALGPEGRTYVADLRRSRVLAFSPELELLAVLGGGELLDPSDLAVSADGKELWVMDAGHRRLAVLSTDGSSSRILGADAGLVRPHGLALAPDGTVWVTDAGADRVLILDREGQVLSAFGRRGLGASEFDKPRGIAFDGAGHAIVLDHGNHRGQVFDSNGEFLSAFGARLYVRETRRRGGP
jgi:hypothetical protein